MWIAAHAGAEGPVQRPGEDHGRARVEARSPPPPRSTTSPAASRPSSASSGRRGPNGNNLHRNVIFRDGKDKADQIIPLSYYDTGDPEELWKWMAAYEQKTGGKMLAIPHNGNLSNGLMFDDVTLTDEEAARPRLRAAPHALGADLRDHPAEGRRRDAPGAVAATTSSPTSNAGTRAASGRRSRRPTCCRANTHAKRSSAAWPTRRSSASTRSSSA